MYLRTSDGMDKIIEEKIKKNKKTNDLCILYLRLVVHNSGSLTMKIDMLKRHLNAWNSNGYENNASGISTSVCDWPPDEARLGNEGASLVLFKLRKV